jgi:hypothetical protein
MARARALGRAGGRVAERRALNKSLTGNALSRAADEEVRRTALPLRHCARVGDRRVHVVRATKAGTLTPTSCWPR